MRSATVRSKVTFCRFSPAVRMRMKSSTPPTNAEPVRAAIARAQSRNQHADELALLSRVRHDPPEGLTADEIAQATVVLGSRGLSAQDRLGPGAWSCESGTAGVEVAALLRTWRQRLADPESSATILDLAAQVIRSAERTLVELSEAVGNAGGWLSLKGLVATAAQLTDTLAADPLAHVGHGYHRFRRYAPRMLRALDIRAAPVADPLLAASKIVAGTDVTPVRPLAFLRRGSKWQRHLGGEDDGGRLWEVAVLFHLREAFRSGDVWLAHSRRFGDLKEALVPAEVARAAPKLAMPLEPNIGIWCVFRPCC